MRYLPFHPLDERVLISVHYFFEIYPKFFRKKNTPQPQRLRRDLNISLFNHKCLCNYSADAKEVFEEVDEFLEET